MSQQSPLPAAPTSRGFQIPVVHISRNQMVPLNECGADQLRRAARWNRSQARKLSRQGAKPKRIARAKWNLRTADFLEKTAELLEDAKTPTVDDLPGNGATLVVKAAVKLLGEE